MGLSCDTATPCIARHRVKQVLQAVKDPHTYEILFPRQRASARIKADEHINTRPYTQLLLLCCLDLKTLSTENEYDLTFTIKQGLSHMLKKKLSQFQVTIKPRAEQTRPSAAARRLLKAHSHQLSAKFLTTAQTLLSDHSQLQPGPLLYSRMD